MNKPVSNIEAQKKHSRHSSLIENKPKEYYDNQLDDKIQKKDNLNLKSNFNKSLERARSE